MQQGEQRPRGLNRAIWSIAFPAMLTNIATALFGLADIWVIGQLGHAPSQAAVEIGAKFMMALLIVFNFLRTGTIALTAQASGRRDGEESAANLVRAVGLAFFIGLLLFLLKPIAVPAGLALLYAKGAVAAEASLYIGIRYWGALLWLINAALVGWLIGRRRVRIVLAAEVASNLIHIALDLSLVLAAGWGIEGVAIATLTSEGVKLAMLAMAVARDDAASGFFPLFASRRSWSREALLRMLRMNRDLFLRTLLLTGASLILTRAGAHKGAAILAANGVLYQLFMLAALILDGFESAAQVLCGEAAGARNRAQFDRLVRLLIRWGLAGGLLVSGLYAAFGGPIARTFSTDPEVIAAIRLYAPWAILLPIAGVTSFVFDGIFIGAGWTRAMLVTMAAAFLFYVLLLLAAAPLGNHGIWLAFSLFLVARAAGQALIIGREKNRSFAQDLSAHGG
jgi:multidrug resistance protein, MATE family